MARYLAGVDVGTTGARCVLFDLAGKAYEGLTDSGAFDALAWIQSDC